MKQFKGIVFYNYHTYYTTKMLVKSHFLVFLKFPY